MTHRLAEPRLLAALRHGSELSKALSAIQLHAQPELSLERCVTAVGQILGWFYFEIVRPIERADPRLLDRLSTEGRDWAPEFPEGADDLGSAFLALDAVLEQTMAVARSCEVDAHPSSEALSQLAELITESQAAVHAVRIQGAV